jgi:putative ABC transport system ATP-binding protein
MITCKNLSKHFKSGETVVKALDNVDLEISRGEFLMIMGPSGCGKTTLLSIIAGILKPDSGDCFIDSLSFSSIEKEEMLTFRAKNIGFIFQAFNLIPTLNVIENVCLPLLILGNDYQYVLHEAQKTLKTVGLSGKEYLKPQSLSGGQQQRVAIARSLVHKPKILICDEPTSALDHSVGNTIMTLMKELNKEFKITCVIVTHDPRIVSFADRIAYMDDGKIIRIEK